MDQDHESKKNRSESRRQNLVVRPKDPAIYWELVRFYCAQPVELRKIEPVCRMFRDRLEKRREPWVPSEATMQRWLWYGVDIPGMEPMKIAELAVKIDSGKFRLDDPLITADELLNTADEALSKLLNLAVKMLEDDAGEELLLKNPRIFERILARVERLQERLSARTSKAANIGQMDREQAMRTIADIMERFPDLAPGIAKVAGQLAEEREAAEIEPEV